MKPIFFILFSSITILAKSQSSSQYVNSNDSTLSVFEIVQKEIRTKEIGDFEYKSYHTNGNIQSKVKIKNFYPKENSKDIWTIVSKYEYSEKGILTNKSYWKTDNISKACECNEWMKKHKPFINLLLYHPRCNKIQLNCDDKGKFATK